MIRMRFHKAWMFVLLAVMIPLFGFQSCNLQDFLGGFSPEEIERLIDLAQHPTEVWRLRSMGPINQPVSPVAGTEITLIVNETSNPTEFRIGGSAGCNTYQGSATDTGTAISVGPLATTLIACGAPDGIMEQEAAYLAALGSAESFDILEGNDLVLYYDNGQQSLNYQFKSSSAPGEVISIGKVWLLTSFGNINAPTPVQSNVGITITFNESGTVTGTTGCNFYSGGYAVTGATLSITNLATSKKACASDVMDRERLYLAALGTVSTYLLEFPSLTLFNTDRTEALIFSNAEQLGF